MKYILSLLCLLACIQVDAARSKLNYKAWSKKQVDLVVFSFDRPMQLYAFLESLETYVSNPHQIHVIYRCTDKQFSKGYDKVFKRFAYVQGHKQGKKPQKDFKKLVKKYVLNKKSHSPYIMFAVDDIIITDKIDLVECTKALDYYHAWFFSLRLGKNITKNTMAVTQTFEPVHTGVPNGKDLKKNMFTWRFDDPSATGSWDYPNSTDLTIYRKKDLKRFIKKADYTNPNIFESVWHMHWQPRNKKGLCYNVSKCVNMPLNVVNPHWQSANVNISTWELLDKFFNGYKIDIGKFYQIDNYAPHMPYEPTFIPIDQKPALIKNGTKAPPAADHQANNPTSAWIQEQLNKLD
ncbi:MAG: hypothetical protein JSR37_03100 [Verrucomicrobia bacterium]|nr:hypothetical protein [Verrucomicrobiota bacterium]